jgi:hypothetical protein
VFRSREHRAPVRPPRRHRVACLTALAAARTRLSRLGPRIWYRPPLAMPPSTPPAATFTPDLRTTRPDSWLCRRPRALRLIDFAFV